MNRTLTRVWWYLRALLPAIVLWQIIAMVTANPVILPTPVVVAESLAAMISDGTLTEATGISLRRLAIAYLLAVVSCVPLGLLMGMSRTLRDVIDPVVEMLRPISGIAWIPLALVLFGFGDTLVLFIIFYGAAFPILLNTIAGVREVDTNLVNSARTFGTPRLGVVTQVILPGALPTIFVGLRLGLGTAWMSLVAAELIGAGSGLGYQLSFARQMLMSAEMMAGIVVIGILGALSSFLITGLQHVIAPWSAKEAA
ncbi:ABC transporter permease [Ruania zhangjianzhongii]|uniref:ABC transporter permease n=1 Tax=Ruania zhangjianzhongii TaxID=2603206 RepID=UPI0011C91E1A|nr:ABC transporter permease [Ruania zhangjianzhongii]